MPRTNRPFLRKRLLPGILIAVLFLAAVEVVFRLAGIGDKPLDLTPFFLDHRGGEQLYDPDPDLFWKLHPNPDRSINDKGIRGRESLATKTKFRILCLGDSITYGFRLDAGKTYPAYLQGFFGDRAEVIAAGVPGYSIVQGFRYYGRDLDALDADLVLIQFGFNDRLEAYVPDSQQPHVPNWARSLHATLGKLHLYGLLVSLGRDAEPEPGTVRVTPEEFAETCHLLDDKINGSKGAPVFLIMPHFDRDTGAISVESYRPPSDVPTIDASAYFHMIPADRRQQYFIDSIHLTATGNHFLAKMLAQELDDRLLLPDSASQGMVPVLPQHEETDGE